MKLFANIMIIPIIESLMPYLLYIFSIYNYYMFN